MVGSRASNLALSNCRIGLGATLEGSAILPPRSVNRSRAPEAAQTRPPSGEWAVQSDHIPELGHGLCPDRTSLLARDGRSRGHGFGHDPSGPKTFAIGP